MSYFKNMKIFYFITTAILCFTSPVYGAEVNITNPIPTDSTTSVVNRVAATYLINEGKKAFNQGRKLDALKRFREAYVRDKYSSTAAMWIGEAHYSLNNYGYALNYAKIAQSLSKSKDGDISLLLGKSYHRQNMLDSAMIFYALADKQLSTIKKNTHQLFHLISEVKYAQSLSNEEIKFKKILMSENINSGYNDYCAFFINNGKGLYFVSRRPDTKGGNINPDDQQFFEDIYYSQWNDSINDWGKSTNELERLNTEGFDAISHISEDGTRLFLTVNTSVLNISNSTRGSDIFTSELTKEGKWSKPKPITAKSINTTFFDGAPTLTADGNTMYFVSDREGDKSKSDIYVVNKEGKSWGATKKLPMTVNTKENETTPFITPDGRFLFFSSDGREGMGGYDIYVTENLGNSWSEPKNLGSNFNTVNDDIFFRYFPTLNKGLLSTYRIQGNKSSLDIFEIELEGWEIPK